MHRLLTLLLTVACTSASDVCTVLQGETGTLQYPMEGQTYPAGVDICWTIDCSEHVELSWEAIDVQAERDFVFINGVQYDRLPSYKMPTDYDGKVTVRFASVDSDGTHKGFVVKWTCGAQVVRGDPTFPNFEGELVTEPFQGKQCFSSGLVEGVLDYPIGDKNYENNEDRCWVIKCDKYLDLQWVKLDVRNYFDLVSVNGVQYEKTASYAMPQSLQGDATIGFTTDEDYTRTGFTVKWQCVDTPPVPVTKYENFDSGLTSGNCFSTMSESGTLDYPVGDGKYEHNEDRCFTIKCDRRLTLSWKEIDVQKRFDFVFVNGVKYDAVPTYKMPTEFNGDVSIRLTSDDSRNYKGIVVDWTCGDVLPKEVFPGFDSISPSGCPATSKASGKLTYPMSSGTYQANEDRCWTINCAADGYLSLKWVHFDLRESYDFLHLNGERQYAKSLEELPTKIQGSMTVRMTSQDLFLKTGFSFMWACVPKDATENAKQKGDGETGRSDSE